jgi:hypothetical protein
MFWEDNEARVATAPSGIMKKRKDGFSIFALLFGVGVALLMIVVDDRYREGVFPGDVVNCFICFAAGNLWRRNQPRFSSPPSI